MKPMYVDIVDASIGGEDHTAETAQVEANEQESLSMEETCDSAIQLVPCE